MPTVYTLPTNHADNVEEIITAATINDLAAAVNEISARRPQIWPKHLSGMYYAHRNYSGGAASLTPLIANQMYANYIPIPEPGANYDRIEVEVGTLAAGAIARLMIFADDGTGGRPGTLLLDAGTVSVATTGRKAIAINLFPPSGGVWVSIVSDGAPQIYRVDDPAVGAMGEDASNNEIMGWNYALGGTTAPDPFSPSAVLDNQSAFIIWLRRA